MEIFNTAIGVLGLLLAVVPVSAYLRARNRGRATIDFSRRRPVDLVLTQSASTSSSSHRKMIRPLTGIGQVQGVATTATFMGLHYAKKEVRVHLSGHIAEAMDSDEVVLGGPAKNEEAARLLPEISQAFRLKRFIYHDLPIPPPPDSPPNIIEIETAEGRIIEVPQIDPKIVNGFPTRDIVLVALFSARNLRGERRRIVVSSGLTSYGTFAGVQHLFRDVSRFNRRRFQEMFTCKRARGVNILMVLEVEFSGGNQKRSNARFVYALPPGRRFRRDMRVDA